jgi:hypothetical protein
MSGAAPAGRDPNVVGNVLGVLTGVVMVAAAGYLFVQDGPRELMLPLGGFGALIVIVGTYSAVETVRELRRDGITDPVAILKTDARPRDQVVGRLARLALLWVGLLVFYAVVLSTPSEAPADLLGLAWANPVIAAGVVLVNLVLVVASVFVRRGTRIGGSGGAF